MNYNKLQKNQLGRHAPEGSIAPQPGRKERRPESGGWHAAPGLVPGVAPRHGRRATWVGASADQTFMRIDESLINPFTLKQSSLMANKTCIRELTLLQYLKKLQVFTLDWVM